MLSAKYELSFVQGISAAEQFSLKFVEMSVCQFKLCQKAPRYQSDKYLQNSVQQNL